MNKICEYGNLFFFLSILSVSINIFFVFIRPFGNARIETINESVNIIVLVISNGVILFFQIKCFLRTTVG